jgi:SAM-dependent methyltransferase
VSSAADVRVPLDAYYSTMESELSLNPGNLRFGNSKTFNGVEFAGRSLLDIGAGAGIVSCYAACLGASRVVALEPEAAGSHAGAVRTKFERVQKALGLSQVELRAETLQAFEPAGEKFDLLTSMASINHLDEAACIRLKDDQNARDTYLEIFTKLADLATPGATLIVSDVARRNLFGDLGVPHPIARSIEWEKHQSPALWASLLEQAGFTNRRIRWGAFNSLRRPGQRLLGNRVAAYLLTSGFSLRMTRA